MTLAARESTYDEVVDGAFGFRILLAAMARPGTIHDFGAIPLQPPPHLPPASAAVALALLSPEASFTTVSLPESVAAYLRANTRGQSTNSGEADFLFFGSAETGEEHVALAKRGSLTYPDLGATVVAPLLELSAEPGPGRIGVRAEGPGIDGFIKFYTRGLHPVWLATLRASNAEYPVGVDAIFTCGTRLLCLPRSASFDWE